MTRSTAPKGTSAGFTLIEVLVALAIVAISLSAIGALVSTTVRGTRSIDRQLNLIETTRTIVTALPDRARLETGNFSGTYAGYQWRVGVSPFVPGNIDVQQPTKWIPELINLTVRSSDGALMQIDTVRLHAKVGR